MSGLGLDVFMPLGSEFWADIIGTGVELRLLWVNGDRYRLLEGFMSRKGGLMIHVTFIMSSS
jgi:hypothetical protein